MTMKACFVPVLLLAAMAGSANARASLPLNVHALKRRVLASSNSATQVSMDDIIELYEKSFVGRCLDHYGLSDYLICELEKLPDNITSGFATLDMPETSPGTGVEHLMEIAQTYNISDMDVDTCTAAFVGYDSLECAFLISIEDIKAFAAGAQTNFSGVDACADLVSVMQAATDPNAGEDAALEASTAQCMQDSSGENRRRALEEFEEDSLADSTAADSTGLVEEDAEAEAAIAKFNAIADKCDEVAPNTVSRPPSPASLTFPSLVTLATVLAFLALLL